MKLTIGIAGVGYVGLTQAVCMASYLTDTKFIAYDIDKGKIDKLSKGEPTIYENGLSELLEKDLSQGNLTFTNNINSLSECSIIFIAVGTPTIAGEQDLRFLKNVVSELSSNFSKEENENKELCLVIKSTVLPGTCEMVAKMVNNNHNIIVANNPEFLKEGTSISDFLSPDKVVLGIDQSHRLARKYSEILVDLYLPIVDKEVIISSSLAVSQACKYVNNDMLGTKIAKINEYRTLFDTMSEEEFSTLMKSLGCDKRISKEFLKSGPGFGGSCFKKDILALVDYARYNNKLNKLPLLNSTILSNENRVRECSDKIINIINSSNPSKVLFLGAAFKSGTDDVRYSTAIDVIRNVVKCISKEIIISIHDPEATYNAKIELSDLNIDTFYDIKDVESLKNIINNYEIIVILTEWPIYSEVFSSNVDVTVIDTRHIVNYLSFKKLISI